jgi:hypothetical protein
MYEIDFIGVGDSASADAIAMRFTDPGNGATAHVLVDGGWQQDGSAVLEHLWRHYDGHLDLVVCTHPDGDHIGGLGQVIRECSVANLWIHRPVLYGAPRSEGFAAAEDLADVAIDNGVSVATPWAGASAFGGALLVAGPTEDFYLECLAAQLRTQKSASASAGRTGTLTEAARHLLDRALSRMPIEVPFGDAGGTNGRNNSSMILSLATGSQRFLLTADAGVPALDGAIDILNLSSHAAVPLLGFKLPHHGSRHNLDLETIERILGPQTSSRRGSSMACVAPNSDAGKLPSGRVSNACARRGYPVFTTRNGTATYHGDGSTRQGLTPLEPLGPLEEESD